MGDRATLLELDKSLERAVRHWPADRIAMRAAGTDDAPELRLEGYACVTNYGYEMYGGAPYGWTEIVARGAFRKTLSERADVQLLINHGGLPLARTKSGTLALDEDQVGLSVDAQLEPADTDVQQLKRKMGRGDIDEMSMAFRITRQRWEDEDGNEEDPMIAPVRRILEINLSKGDVSVVNYGANDAAGASMRDLDMAFAEMRSGQLLSKDRAELLRRWLDAATITDVDDNRRLEGEPAPAVDPPAQRLGRSLAAARHL